MIWLRKKVFCDYIRYNIIFINCKYYTVLLDSTNLISFIYVQVSLLSFMHHILWKKLHFLLKTIK